jgi:putative colanic acid biosynthesis UDP-glucose lipid carrier transferase
MQSRYARLFQIIIILGDLLVLNLCFLLAGYLRFDEIRIRETEYYDYYVQLAVFFNISWLFLTFLFRTYDTRRSLEPRKATGKVLNAFFIHLFILLLFLVSLKKDEYSRLFLIYFYSSFLVVLLPWRFYFLRILQSLRKRGLNYRKVLVIGEGSPVKLFHDRVQQHSEYGLKIVGYFSDYPVEDVKVNGSESEALSFLKENEVDEIYCAFPSGDPRVLKWFRIADKQVARFRLLPDLGLAYAPSVEIDYYHDVPILLHRKEPLEYLHNRIFKRLSDILLSLLMIVLVFPWLFPLLAIGVRMSGPGPVFFKQKRTGLGDRDFNIFKFRSMQVNETADELQATEGDPRITGIGHFMRRHNLDELPQFFNVLSGEMSVVGPRPHMLAHTSLYREMIDRYMVRHFAKPGITGLAQVRGLRGETRTPGEMAERVKTDVYYIENWSLLLDLKIIAITAFKTFTGRG